MAFPIVVAGAVAPVDGASASAIVPVGVPDVFRIGPERHGYVYTRMTAGLWKCRRGSDWKQHAEVLFLVNNNGYWTAMDAPGQLNVLQDVLEAGHPIFRSQQDVLTAGWHEWETNYAARPGIEWRATGLSCMTTINP